MSASVSFHESKGGDSADDMTLGSIMDDPIDTQILPQGERIKRFGVECLGPAGDGICFKAGTWKPGGEYVQKLFVRNVSTSVKKLKYTLPSTRFFSLAYPEVIILSPGMSQELDVIFRPVEKDPYDDTILIKVFGSSGGFRVSVRATIDKLAVSSPYGVDLGFCPTYQTTSQIFKLSNTGEIDAPFRWDQPKGFKLEPSNGIIPGGETMDIRVSIIPTDASVVVAQAVCTVGEGVHALIDEPTLVTRLSAIGKYAYISLSESEVNFGEVLTGTHADAHIKEIVLRNTSVVPAEFSLVRHETDADSVFELYPKEGVIPPQSEQIVSIRYHALAFGSYSLDRFTYITPGDCRTSVAISGTCMPAKVTLQKEAAMTPGTVVVDGNVVFPDGAPANSLNFRDVELGKAETRILQVRNRSDHDVYVNICTGSDGVFRVDPPRGVIKAEGPPFNIIVTFTPNHPINYYKRIWIMVGDSTPLFFDNMGSGYIRAKGDIKEQRPAPLRHAHVQAYRNRAVHGMGGLNPDELDEAYRSESADPAIFAQIGQAGTRPMSLTTLTNPLTRSGETNRNTIAIAHEFFIEDSDHSCREITSSQTAFEFGYIPSHTTSESKSVTISNNTNGKVTLIWQIPRTMNDTGEFEQPAFDVFPPQDDIGPGQSASFKIVFRPFQTDRNFVGELEAYVFFKNQRTFRLVNDTTLTPPWCLSFNVSGHTFSAGQLLASARLFGGNIRQGKLVFPSCFEGETLYQSVILRNTSNLPSIFRFELGFGEGGIGDGFGGGNTAVDVDAFAVRPLCGEIPAESFAVVYIRFTPSKARKFIQLLRCSVNGDPSTKLLLEGTSSVPYLVCPDVTSDDPTLPPPPDTVVGSDNSERVLNYLSIPGVLAPPHRVPNGPIGSFYMKPTCVGLSTSRKFSLKNQSRLPLRYRLIMPPEAQGIFTVTPMKGLLRGNQTTQLIMAFAPNECNKFCFKVKIKVYPIGGRAQRVIDANQPMSTAAPEVLQTLSVLVVAPSETGAIQFDPPRISMDVRLVNTIERQELYLENVSDSEVSYKLLYKESYIRDTGDSSDISPEVSALVPLTSDGGHEESLMCDFPEGILPARSRTRAPLTFQPTRAGLFDFAIFCTVRAAKDDDMAPNEEIALARVSAKDRENQFDGQGFLALEGLPLLTQVTTRATFPKINIADVRTKEASLISDVEHLWRNFSLKTLNTDLSKPLTAEECKVNASSSPDLSKLKRYKFEFTPNVVGAPQQTVTFLLKNEGHLTTSFHLHLPNEKELELEQWCDEDEPSEELNKIICMIEELKLFTIEPQHGILEPGQAQSMSITYSHAHLKFGGIHNLPVHVKLDKGKQFFFDLIGRTLPNGTDSSITSGSQVLTNAMTPTGRGGSAKVLPLTNIKALPPSEILLTACTGQDRRYELAPIPIGLDPSEAPLQRMELINVSGARAVYEINMRSIDAVSDQNFGQPILRVANPSGVVEPRSTVMIEWYFYPIEAKNYEIPIKILYEKTISGVDMDMPETGELDGLAQNSLTSATSGASNDASLMGSTAMRLPSPPPRSGKSGGRSRQKNSTGQEIKFTLVCSGYDPRDKVLVGNTIMPRPESDKIPEPHIFGAIPPTEQLIKFPEQLISVSSDLLDLSFIPQCSKCSRLVVIRNLLAKEAIEFSIPVEKCLLANEGLLNVYPTSGKLEPGEHVLVDFNFNLDVRSIHIMDRVEITAREIVATGGTRRRGMPNKLLDRIQKKTAATEHTTVVNRITQARNNQLENNIDIVPDGRRAGMPSTILATGKVKAGASYTKNQEYLEGSVSRSQGVSFETSFADGSLSITEGFHMEDSKSGSRAAGSTAGSKIGGSGLMSRNRNKSENTKNLRGNSTTSIIRIRGFVLPYETTYKLFDQMGGHGVMQGIHKDIDKNAESVSKLPATMADFFVPPNPKFIPYITSATFLGGNEEAPQKSKLANALSKINPQKEFEIRDISQVIMHDLFRSIVSSGSVKEYVTEVINDVAESSVKTEIMNGSSVINTATLQVQGDLNANVKLTGRPMNGFFIDDIRASLKMQNSAISDLIEESLTATNNSDKLVIETNEDPELASVDEYSLTSSVKRELSAIEIKKEETAKMQLALSQPHFCSLTAEILRNTMYNLMQEASFDEFPITAAPLTFAIRED
jgi:cilia- and flagella-associated protein 65